MDVGDLTLAATSSPEEAATNIRNANLVGTTPTNDSVTNDAIKPIADDALKPTQMTPAVADYAGQSTEHTSLVLGDTKDPQQSDVHKFNFIDSASKFIGDLVYDRPTEDQELTDLAMKKSKAGGTLNDDDKYRLWELNQNRQTQAQDAYNQPPEPPLMKTAEAVGEGAANMVRSLRHNYQLIGGFAAGGALLTSSLDGNPISGAAMGLRLGVAAGFANDAYKTGYGGTYNELDRMTKADGTPLNMDETTKTNLSQGVGLVSAAIMTGAGYAAASKTPWMNSILSPKLAAAAVQSTGNSVLRSALFKIGQSVTALGAGSAFTEVAKIYAEEAGKNYDGTAQGFITALSNVADKLSDSKPNEMQQRVNQAAYTGMGTGLVFGGGLALLNRGGNAQAPLAPEAPLQLPAGPSEPPGGAGPVIEGEFTKPSDEEFRQAQAQDTSNKLGKQQQFLEDFLQKPNLTDQQKINLNNELNSVKGQIKTHQVLTGITPEAQDDVDDSVKVLHLQDSLEQIAQQAGSTKMQAVAPQETKAVLTKVLERANMSKFFMKDWSWLTDKGQDQVEAANNALDSSGLTAAKMNAPAELSAVDVLMQGIKDKNIFNYISLKPNSPTPMQARDHLEKIQQAEETRQKLFSQLGIEPKDAQEQASQQASQQTWGGTVIDIKEAQKAPTPPYDFEGAARRTGELLEKKKDAQQRITERTALLEQMQNAEVPGINDKKTIEKLRQRLKKSSKKIADIDAELEKMKGEVTEAAREPTGHLLVGDWDNPGREDSQRAVSDFVNEPTYTEALQKALPKSEVQKFNVAHQNARKDIADHIKQTATDEMNKVQDQTLAESREIRQQEEFDRIANDPNYKIVDKIRAASKASKKTKFPFIYAINPMTLSGPALKYADSPRVKEIGILKKKGGQPADEVAQSLGVKDAEALFKILANTPTREQVAKARAKAYATSDEMEVRSKDDLNHRRIIEAINADATNQAAVMKFMREQEWPATKGAIKRIALYPPTVEEWNQKAKDMIMQTKVGSLNPMVYRVAERKNHREAVRAILKIDPDTAFQHLENRGISLAALKLSYTTTARINRGFEFARQFNKKSTQQLLKAAGPTTFNAAAEILHVFKLTKSRGGLPTGIEAGPNGSFLKWASREVREGRGDFSIPESLTDLRQNAEDMTVEQFLTIVDRLRAIFNEAKLHDKIQRIELAEKESDAQWDLDRFAEKVVAASNVHPGANLKKLPPGQHRTGMEKAHLIFGTPEAFIAPKQSIYHELDQYQAGGFFYRNFDEEIEGAGKYYQKAGFTYVKKWNDWIDENLRKLFKEHGNPDELEKMLEIPEFKDIWGLNNGKLTKADLLSAMANRGQQYTKTLLNKNNGEVSDEVWQKVFDRELETRDVRYMQGIVDLYKDAGLRAKTKELQTLDGREVTFIEGLPFTHKGVTYPGGYIRARYLTNWTKHDTEKAKDIESSKGATFYDPAERSKYTQFASETTDQGYLISRTDSNKQINLAFHTLVDGLREIVHDHAYRIPMRNFWTKMDHPDVIPSMTKIVGEAKVSTIININLELANRPVQKDDGYFSNTNRMMKAAVNRLGNNFAISVICGNISAVIKQAEALPEMYNFLGPRGAQHFFRVNAVYLANLDKFWGFVRSATNLDPNLAKYINGIDDDTNQVMDRWVPKKGQKIKNSLPGLTYQALMSAGFLPHQAADAYLKAVQAHTILSMVLAGHHPSYPQEKLDKMNDDEKFEAIRSLIQQMSTLTQIQNRPELKAPLQKNILAKPFSLFWNYPRTVLNNNIKDARRTIWKMKEANTALGEGGGGFGKPPSGGGGGGGGNGGGGGESNPGGAMKAAASGANIALTRMILNFMGASILYWAAHRTFQGFFPDRKVDWKDPKDVADFGNEVMHKMFASNLMVLLEASPTGKSVAHAIESKKKYQQVDVQDLISQTESIGVTALQGLTKMLWLNRHPNRFQVQAMLKSESFSLVPYPVNGYSSAVKWMEQNTLAKPSGDFKIELNDHAAQNAHEEIKEIVNNPGNMPKEMVDEAKKINQQLAPSVADIPKNAADTIKMAESQGQWQAPNGLYGFTPEAWKAVQRAAPDLGLTDSGRISKDTAQQEKAMDWQLRENAGRLSEKDIPVNSTTLYEAHKLGVDLYLKLFEAHGDEKVKTALPELGQKFPELGQFKTIGQVKAFLRDKADAGEKAVATPTAARED